MNIIKTDKIPIWDERGVRIDEVVLPEVITPTVGRRGGFGDSGVYYKGAGIIYRGHLTNEPKPYEKVLKQDMLVYQRYTVINTVLVKKFGIFNFPHQPVFTDYEGACGKKEKRLLENQKEFQLSAIAEIVDVIDTSLPEHKIYAYTLKNLRSEPKDVLRLLEYILKDDFNSAWDKNLWEDIAGYCYVRDIADWFRSKEFRHKLGTVYALLHSIYAVDKYLFAMITNEIVGYNYMDALYIPYISALIVKKYCPQVAAEFDSDLACFDVSLHRKLWNEIYSGIACCHLEQEDNWAWVRDSYREDLNRQCDLLQQEIWLDRIRYQEIMNEF